MDKYTELYAWIWKVFGKGEFSIDQFRSIFPTSQGPKVVHDLVKKGYLQRVGRGVYRTVEPEEFIANIAEKEADFVLMEKAEKEYAFCKDTAVSIWTDGYYWTGFTMGFKPVSLAIRKKDINFWKKFFKKTGLKYALERERRTLYGQVFMLHPREKLTYTEKDGLNVVALEEVVKFCLAHKLVYEPALEYLDEKYNISYGKREQTVV